MKVAGVVNPNGGALNTCALGLEGLWLQTEINVIGGRRKTAASSGRFERRLGRRSSREPLSSGSVPVLPGNLFSALQEVNA